MKLEQEFEQVELDRLCLHPSNPRSGDIALIGESIRANGFFGAIVAQRSTGRILAGNHRWKAAKAEGKETVPVAWVDVDDEHATRILLADNRTNDVASYDERQLAGLLAELNESCGLEGTGYKPEDLEQLLADISPQLVEGNTDPDDMPEDVEPRCKRGDIWRLGNHRLMCGDSTNGDVARLMDGQTADMCFTSPPYNAGNITNNTGAYFSGSENRTDFKRMYTHDRDAMASDEYKAFLWTVLDRIAENVSESACVMWNVSYNANSRREYGEIAFGHSELCVQETIVWDKNVGMNVCAKNVYSRSAELVFLLSKTSKYKSNQKGGVFWNIWRTPTRDGDNMQNGHGASFPVKLPAQGIGQHSDEGDIVYEPFMGSGTTMIASEQLGRKCYGMEIDPKYCDVAIKRWEDFTGKKAVKAMSPDVTK